MNNNIDDIVSKEREISDCAVTIWNTFIKLKQTHPSDIDDMNKAIHDIQKIMAMRLVRREFPDKYMSYCE